MNLNALKDRLSKIAERLAYLSSKIDSGRFKYAEKQEQDRLVQEYLDLEKQIEIMKKG